MVLITSACATMPAETNMVELGTLGGRVTVPLDINDDGVIAGHAQTPDGAMHAVRWDRHGVITDLGDLGGTEAEAQRVNAHGEIVGRVLRTDGHGRAVRWDAQGTPVELGPLPGQTDSWAMGINDSGVVVGGTGTRRAPGQRAVRWDRSGRITALGAPDAVSNANAINNAGTAVGVVSTARGGVVNQAARWDADGDLTMLEALPGTTQSFAIGISDAGVTVGYAVTVAGESRAVRWDRQGRVTDLTPPSATGSTPTAISADGTIIGSVMIDDLPVPVRWNRQGRMTTLDLLPGEPSNYVSGVDRRGVVVGWTDATPIRWDRQGRVAALPNPHEGTSCVVSEVNDRGLAIGYASSGDGTFPLVWRLPR